MFAGAVHDALEVQVLEGVKQRHGKGQYRLVGEARSGLAVDPLRKVTPATKLRDDSQLAVSHNSRDVLHAARVMKISEEGQLGDRCRAFLGRDASEGYTLHGEFFAIRRPAHEVDDTERAAPELANRREAVDGATGAFPGWIRRRHHGMFASSVSLSHALSPCRTVEIVMPSSRSPKMLGKSYRSRSPCKSSRRFVRFEP